MALAEQQSFSEDLQESEARISADLAQARQRKILSSRDAANDNSSAMSAANDNSSTQISADLERARQSKILASRDAANDNSSATYADQYNRAPAGSAMPLVSGDDEDVGLSAAYSGDNYQGAAASSVPGGSSGVERSSVRSSGSTENGGAEDDQLPVEQNQQQGGIKGAINDRMSGVMSLVNRRKIRALENAVKDTQEQINQIDKNIKDFYDKNIKPLRRQALRATVFDTLSALRRQLMINVPFWWWTIIGAIIDIIITLPAILILYGSGVIKGKAHKLIKLRMKAHEKKIETMEKSKIPLERRKQQLRQEQFQLTQFFAAEQAQQTAQPGQPPTVGGIPLAS